MRKAWLGKRYYVVLCVIFGFLVSPAFSQDSGEVQVSLGEKIVRLEETVSALRRDIELSVNTIKDISQIAISTTRSNNQLVTGVFGVVGILFSVATVMGIRSAKQLRKLAQDAEKEIQTAKRDMHSANLVVRAIYEITYSEIAKASGVKKSRLRDAVKMLDFAEQATGESAILSNWKAYAYKRLGEVSRALSEAERAVSLSTEGEYEHTRARYNKACYLSLLGRSEDAINELEQVVRGMPEQKALARNDSDFIGTEVGESERFRNLVSEKQ